MKQWDIQKIDNMKYSCFHYGLAEIANYYHRDYQMVFLELWGFFYSENNNRTIGENLDLYWINEDGRRERILNEFHQIRYKKVSNQGRSEEFIEKMNEEIEKSPFVAYLDAFDCEWLPFYQKQHLNHSIVICGSCEEAFLFFDQYTKETLTLSKNFVKNHCNEFYSFEKKIQKEFSYQFLRDEFRNGIGIFDGRQMLKQLKQFIEDMKYRLDLQEEIIKEDPTKSLLVMKLKYLSEDRYNLVEALEYIESKTSHNLIEAKNTLVELGALYDHIRSYIVKSAYLIKGLNHNVFDEQLCKLLELETKLYELFRCYIIA